MNKVKIIGEITFNYTADDIKFINNIMLYFKDQKGFSYEKNKDHYKITGDHEAIFLINKQLIRCDIKTNTHFTLYYRDQIIDIDSVIKEGALIPLGRCNLISLSKKNYENPQSKKYYDYHFKAHVIFSPLQKKTFQLIKYKAEHRGFLEELSNYLNNKINENNFLEICL